MSDTMRAALLILGLSLTILVSRPGGWYSVTAAVGCILVAIAVAEQ